MYVRLPKTVIKQRFHNLYKNIVPETIGSHFTDDDIVFVVASTLTELLVPFFILFC